MADSAKSLREAILEQRPNNSEQGFPSSSQKKGCSMVKPATDLFVRCTPIFVLKTLKYRCYDRVSSPSISAHHSKNL